MASALKKSAASKGSSPKNKDVVPSTIATQLRSMIAAGVFAPGIRLGQTELATEFDSSRVPVREALKMLSTEGLVEHDPNRGFFVARLSSSEASQLFKLRELVETELLKTIDWPTKKQLAEIKARGNELEKLLNSGNRSDWWEKHREFQEMIFDLSPAKILVREAIRLWGLTDRYRALAPLPRRPSAERDIVNKADIISALEKHDLDGLMEARAMRRNAFKALVLEILVDRGL